MSSTYGTRDKIYSEEFEMYETIEDVKRISCSIWDVIVHVTAIYIFFKFVLSLLFGRFSEIQF